MTQKLDFKKMAKDAKKLSDQSVVTTGGGSREPAPKGKAIARLVSYIELGQQVLMYNGKPKPATPTVMIEFELLGKKHVREVETKDGKKIQIANRIRLQEMPISTSENSRFCKLFKKMRDVYPDVTHMTELFDQPFLVNVVHSEPKGDKKTVYDGIQKDGEFLIYAPRTEKTNEDGEIIDGEYVKLKCPPRVGDIRGFLFDAPSLEQWNSIFIDGEREGNNGEMISKNWIQEKIKKAANFKDSPLAALLLDEDGELDKTINAADDEELPDDLDDLDDESKESEEVEEDPEVDEPEEDEVKTKTKKATVNKAKSSSKKESKKSNEQSEQEANMAELGLI